MERISGGDADSGNGRVGTMPEPGPAREIQCLEFRHSHWCTMDLSEARGVSEVKREFKKFIFLDNSLSA